MSGDPVSRVGARGLALLTVTGLVGIGLAIHGYGRGATAGPGGIGALTASRPTHSHSPARPSAARHAPAGATTTATTQAAAPAQKLGPLLSSTSYAPYSFRVYPGPESLQTRQATAGFRLQVTPQSGSFRLRVAAAGSGQGAQTSSFPSGDRVYFIEASLGDDSGDLDYNFGDDGVVVTDASGHVVQ